MSNNDEVFKQVAQLQEDKTRLYSRLMRDLTQKHVEIDLLKFEYDVEDAKLSAEITMLLNSLGRDE